MMRRIAVVLFGALICQAVNAQVELGHVKKYGFHLPYNLQPSELDIKGNVSQVSYTYHYLKYKFGEMSVSDEMYNSYEYRPILYEYNTDGTLYKYEYYNGSYSEYWYLNYDKIGNYENSKVAEYKYENGKLTKISSFDYLSYVARLFYTNGQLSKVIQYTRDGAEDCTAFFNNGDLVKQVSHRRGWTVTYSYNNHRLISCDDGTTTSKITYDENGLVARIVYYKNRQFAERSDYIYKFDSHGNWIMRTEVWTMENGDLRIKGSQVCGKVTERKITYRDNYGSTSHNAGSQTSASDRMNVDKNEGSTSQNTSSQPPSSNKAPADRTAYMPLLASFVESCNQKDWDKAYNPWTILFKEYPECTQTLYSNGVTIVKKKMSLAKSFQEQQVWIDTLMMVYDQRIKYFAAKSEKYDEGYILGRKGIDILKYRKKSLTEAYNILKKSIDLKGEKTEASVVQYAAQASMAMYKNNQMNLSEFTSDYEQYKKLLPLIECKDGDREQASKALSEMSTLINR